MLALASCATSSAQRHRLDDLQEILAASDSATDALGRWCGRRGFADPPRISARRLDAAQAQANSVDVDRFGLGPGDRIAVRKVALSCGGRVLSLAENRYVETRLTPAMNAALNNSDAPFGTVTAPLGFRRERLAQRRGAAFGCPPATVLSHRAMLWLSNRTPLALLTECYTRAGIE